MKIVQLIQGSQEWHAHRASHWNASDAPAMLGVSPYKARATLLRELATGIGAEVDAATQQRFDDGHRFEALARPLAEQIIGEELYACVGVDGRYSASFDGLTLLEDTAWEHKTLGESLRELMPMAEDEDFSGLDLPEHYRVQMEHQCMVSGAERVLFMATRWEGDQLAEQLWCWYTPDTELRQRIVAGWEQFERDLAAYQPEPVEAPKPIGRTPETLPSLRIEARGMVTASNLDEFRAHALAVLGGINRTLKTDEDFADAEQTVKWCSGVEDRLAAAKANVLGQMADVDAVCRTIDDVAAETRRIRLELDKLVRAEKESRKAELVRAGVDALAAHYADMNQSLGEYAIALDTMRSAEIGASIRGLKTLASMRDKIDAAVAGAKIQASQTAERVRACIALLPTHPDHAILFPDRVQLCRTKQPEDLAMLVAHRIGEHKRREEERERARQQREVEEAERLREQIRQEEEAKARAEFERGQAVLREEEENVRREDEERKATPAAPVRIQPKPQATPESRIKLGDINAAIAPLSITADGLAQLGFPHIATDKAAKLYEAASFEQMLSAMAKTIARADLRREAA